MSDVKEDVGADAVPPPGSIEAVKRGCSCPILDNGYGRGRDPRGETFVINAECPLHAKAPDQ